MKLTEEECDFVEENHNLIYGYAHLRNVSLEEYYGTLAIELCRAIKTYDGDKGSFSNYYYTMCDNALIKEYYRGNRQKRDGGEILSLDYEYTGGECGTYKVDAAEVFGVVEPLDLEEEVEYNRMLEELLEGEYGALVELRMQGYTQMEISQITGYSQSKISNDLAALRKEYFGNE